MRVPVIGERRLRERRQDGLYIVFGAKSNHRADPGAGWLDG